MSQHKAIKLGINVDHIATLREARGTAYPDPAQAAEIARAAGADGVTVHLREDRRHIQDDDVFKIREQVKLPLNLEMAASSEMLIIARQVSPAECCLVPEKRQELTTEGGLDVVAQQQMLTEYIAGLKQSVAQVSLFIDPDPEQIAASQQVGADTVELHTGLYAELDGQSQIDELKRLQRAAALAVSSGLRVNAGHGLHYQNVQAIAAIREIECLNIGHAIISRAALTGLREAVFTIKQAMIAARLEAES